MVALHAPLCWHWLNQSAPMFIASRSSLKHSIGVCLLRVCPTTLLGFGGLAVMLLVLGSWLVVVSGRGGARDRRLAGSCPSRQWLGLEPTRGCTRLLLACCGLSHVRWWYGDGIVLCSPWRCGVGCMIGRSYNRDG